MNHPLKASSYWLSILKVLSFLWLVLAVFMTIPFLLLFIENDSDFKAFLLSIFFVIFLSLFAWIFSKSVVITLRLKQIFVLTVLSWISISFFSSIPLILGNSNLSFTDAFFESVSAITTTGSTVITEIDQLSDGIKLWRGLLQWLGGIGIIVMGIAILPFLKVGGMKLFHTESSDWSDKVLPRTTGIAKTIFLLYFSFTFLAFFSYWLGGMDVLDALVHAMTTIATGGFANSDDSFGAYSDQPHLLWMGTFFMLCGALPFVLYIRSIRGDYQSLFHDQQIRGFFTFLFFVIIALTVFRVTQGIPVSEALTHVSFNVVSVVTTTGYASEDYTLWGPLFFMMFFYLTFIGGCSGSTSGGIKIFRLQIALLMLSNQLKSLIYSNGVFSLRYNRKLITDDITRSIVAFSFFFFLTIAVLAILLSILGLDFITALSASATAVANVGPGLGDVVGPSGNFSSLPDMAKWLLAFGMLLGRLEILTVLILLTPMFWKK